MHGTKVPLTKVSFSKCAVLSTRGGEGAGAKTIYANPKTPNSGRRAPEDRARRSHVARGHVLLPRADTCCAQVFQNIHLQSLS